MQKFIITLSLIVGICIISQAQQITTLGKNDRFDVGDHPSYGTVKIISDARINDLVNVDVNINETVRTISGWRIQIYFNSGTNASADANKTKAEFLKTYPEHKAYVEYVAPFFKVRVGDFRSYIEAMQFLRKIEKEYDNCWIVEDQINFPNL